MQNRTDHDCYRPATADLHQRFEKPFAVFRSLMRRVDVLVAFEIVAYNEVRPHRTMTRTAHGLAFAPAFEANVVASDDLPCFPNATFTTSLGEVFAQTFVGVEFGLDEFEEVRRLLGGIGYQSDEASLPGNDAPQRQY